MEAIPVKRTTFEVVCNFIKENILVRYGVPHKLVADNATSFSSSEISLLMYDYGISLSHSTDYYRQGNGQGESSNKNLISIIKKLNDENKKDWHKRLYEVLWADRMTPKRVIGMSPFELVYRVESALPPSLELSVRKLQTTIEEAEFSDALERRILYLTKIQEQREEMVDKITIHQAKVKRIFDRKSRSRKFMVGDLVLLWDKRREPKGAHKKFDSLWIGPFKITHEYGPNTFRLAYPDGTPLPIPYNGKDLKLYQL